MQSFTPVKHGEILGMGTPVKKKKYITNHDTRRGRGCTGSTLAEASGSTCQRRRRKRQPVWRQSRRHRRVLSTSTCRCGLHAVRTSAARPSGQVLGPSSLNQDFQTAQQRKSASSGRDDGHTTPTDGTHRGAAVGVSSDRRANTADQRCPSPRPATAPALPPRRGLDRRRPID